MWLYAGVPGPPRVALIGYGLSGRYFHRPFLLAAHFTLTHVVTSDAERAATAAREAPGVVVVGSADELWQLADDFDVVVVATPNHLHASLAARAIALEKAVVVDKPMAVTADEAAELVQAAHRRGVLLTVFHNRRWDSDTLTVRRLLSAGVLGNVVRFESRFQRFRPALRESWREAAPVTGGGVLFDLGTHLVDQALFLFGPARTVYAEIDSRRPGAVADDDVFLAIEHRDGVRSHLWASQVAPVCGPRVRVEGSIAGYEKQALDGQEDALRMGWDPARGPFGEEPAGVVSDVDGARPVASGAGNWLEFYRLLHAALEGAGQVPVPAEAGVAALRVLEAARRSAATSAVVSLPR
jgi:predicted dehydrogenase